MNYLSALTRILSQASQEGLTIYPINGNIAII